MEVGNQFAVFNRWLFASSLYWITKDQGFKAAEKEKIELWGCIITITALCAFCMASIMLYMVFYLVPQNDKSLKS